MNCFFETTWAVMKGKIKKGFATLGAAICIGVLFQFSLESRSTNEHKFVFKPSPPPFLNEDITWSDSVYSSLTLEESIGQLFMVASYPRKGKTDIDRVSKLITEQHIGGVIFFQANPEQIADLVKYYQSLSKVPLLFGIDGEWGLSMRLDSTLQYPRQMMLGAINNDDLIYEMGRDIGRQLRLLGIHINFAPVADINNNSENPVISSRSFGELREKVARKSFMYMRGMQDVGIMAVAKHFPGHGDTNVDSHLGLPIISYSKERLDSIELYPFRALIEGGISGVMMAHMNVLSYDTTPGLPSTLSPIVTDSLLRTKLGFKGLIFTDAMGMKGVADLFEPEDANIKALMAGNDIILMPDELEKTVKQIMKLIEQGDLSAESIGTHCCKILQAKKWAVLPERNEKKIANSKLSDSLNSPYFRIAQQKLIESALTLVNDQSSLIPFRELDTIRFASVSLGGQPNNPYQQMLQKYAPMSVFHFQGIEDSELIKTMLDSLSKFNIVLLSIHSDEQRVQKRFGISDRLLEIADAILYNYPTVINCFASPYLLENLRYLKNNKVFVQSYENDSVTQSLSAQMIFGAIGAEGSLPVSIRDTYVANTGTVSQGNIRLKYTLPLEAGFSATKLNVIDSLVEDAISKEAMPGCQVLVARNGKVILQKSYGYFTYSKTHKVENSDLYDLASVTKIVATVPSLLYLDEKDLIEINEPLSKYLPALDSSNKSKLLIRDILLHQAGLKAWIPFYISTLEPMYPEESFSSTKLSAQYPIQLSKNFYANKHLKYIEGYFSKTASDTFPIHVAENLFMNPSLVDSIYHSIYTSELDEAGKYKYSDLGFYLFRNMVEQISHTPFEHFTDSLFYAPLGAVSLGYNPLNKFRQDQIAPTENDLVFRKQLIQGYVHDPGAAMLGGVSGHAGLFSNANDLAKYMQMLLNEGTYGGQRYLSKSLIDEYTTCIACDKGNRRGLGFDKPQNGAESGPTMKGISPESYGHSGFTGTMVWNDPTTGIVYIFLSNRVYPDALNNKLVDLNVRTNIQKAVYGALILK